MPSGIAGRGSWRRMNRPCCKLHSLERLLFCAEAGRISTRIWGSMNFKMKFDRMVLAAGVAATTLLMSGCATPPDPTDEAAVEAYNHANDPLEPMNRYFFEVNHALDELLLKPLAGYYHTALPQFAQD